MLKRAMLLMLSAIAVSLLLAQATAKPEATPPFLPTVVDPPTLEVIPEQLSCPAGSDVIYKLSSGTTEGQSDLSLQGFPVGITGKIRIGPYLDEGELLIHVDDAVPPGLYTAQVSAHTHDYPNPVTRSLTLEVTPCTESPGGRFVQNLDEAQHTLVLQGSDSRALYYRSILLPFQVCGDHPTRRMVITLEKLTLGDLSSEEEPPAFLLLRTLAYPALNDAVVVGVSGFNAQKVSMLPSLTSAGLQLSADVTPGLYLLALRRNYSYTQASPPSVVTYSVELKP